MLSFYQAYQAYERRRMRGEMETGHARRLHALRRWQAALVLSLASLLLRAGNALHQRYSQIPSSAYRYQE